jgi:hypothetical protein
LKIKANRMLVCSVCVCVCVCVCVHEDMSFVKTLCFQAFIKFNDFVQMPVNQAFTAIEH